MSKEERKARSNAKNKLIKELSLAQLLYLAREYNLEDNVDISGGIYEHRIADVLSENINPDDVDLIIEKANSMDNDLKYLELELRLLSKKELKHILRDVDKRIPSSFDFLSTRIWAAVTFFNTE